MTTKSKQQALHLIIQSPAGLSYSTHSDKESTGAVGNLEGFPLQVFNRQTADTTTEAEFREEPAGSDLLTRMTTLSLSSLCIWVYQPAALTEGLGSTSAAAGTAGAACKSGAGKEIAGQNGQEQLSG